MTIETYREPGIIPQPKKYSLIETLRVNSKTVVPEFFRDILVLIKWLALIAIMLGVCLGFLGLMVWIVSLIPAIVAQILLGLGISAFIIALLWVGFYSPMCCFLIDITKPVDLDEKDSELRERRLRKKFRAI